MVDVPEESEKRPRTAARRRQALIQLQWRMRGTLSVNSGIGTSKRVPSSATSWYVPRIVPTAVGTMRGTYQLVAEDGTRFDVPIPEFTLSVPRILH